MKDAVGLLLAIGLSACSSIESPTPTFAGRDTILFVGEAIDLKGRVVGVDGPISYTVTSSNGAVSISGTTLTAVAPGVALISPNVDTRVMPKSSMKVGVVRDLRHLGTLSFVARCAGISNSATIASGFDSARSVMRFTSSGSPTVALPPEWNSRLSWGVRFEGATLDSAITFRHNADQVVRADTAVTQTATTRLITTDTTGWIGYTYQNGFKGMAVPPSVSLLLEQEVPLRALATDSTALRFCGFSSAQPASGMFARLIATP